MFRVIGHEMVVRLIERGLEQDRLHHAYLLTGPRHVGKMTLAVQIAQAVNCASENRPCGDCDQCQRIAHGKHADIQVLGLGAEQEGITRVAIGIDAIRELHNAAYLRPYEGSCRVFIIDEADCLSIAATNALLKTLEEPPPQVLLLLLTSDPESIPSTVVSRCQCLDLRPLSISKLSAVMQTEHKLSPDEANELACLARGCPGWAIQAKQGSYLLSDLHQHLERIADVSRGDMAMRFSYAANLAKEFQGDRREGLHELYLWLRWWRDVMLIQQGREIDITYLAWRESLKGLANSQSRGVVASWLRRILRTVEVIEQNANPRLALEVMMLEMPSPISEQA